MAEKVYTFRKLKADDLFLMLNFVKKLDFKKIAKEAASSKKDGELALGMTFVYEILDNITKIKKDIYAFLSEVSNLNETEISELDIDVFVDMLVDFVERDDVVKLFQRVVSLLK